MNDDFKEFKDITDKLEHNGRLVREGDMSEFMQARTRKLAGEILSARGSRRKTRVRVLVAFAAAAAAAVVIMLVPDSAQQPSTEEAPFSVAEAGMLDDRIDALRNSMFYELNELRDRLGASGADGIERVDLISLRLERNKKKIITELQNAGINVSQSGGSLGVRPFIPSADASGSRPDPVSPELQNAGINVSSISDGELIRKEKCYEQDKSRTYSHNCYSWYAYDHLGVGKPDEPEG